mmetsp:Transcript_1235/g.1422  ORF Transcript_1235/g.1422 Transcript_1235/m.1422 type:complete len:260 (-) Transcript_1235:61-840(-)
MVKDGVEILFKSEVVEVSKGPKVGEYDQVIVKYSQDGESKQGDFDAILLAVGRTPNVENMNLEAAGIEWERSGVKVDNHLATANKNVYAVGDCLPGFKFTHNSDTHARYVVRNALFFGKMDFTKIILPYCTYTDPEISQVGLNEVQLKAQGIAYDTYQRSYDHLDRAICEGQTGHIKVHCKKGTDQILGSTMVGGPAGDMIVHVTQAMTNNMGLKDLGNCVHPYPTHIEAFRGMSDAFNRTKLKPSVKSLIRGLLEFKR